MSPAMTALWLSIQSTRSFGLCPGKRLDADVEPVAGPVQACLADPLLEQPDDVGAAVARPLGADPVRVHQVLRAVGRCGVHRHPEPLHEASGVALVPRAGEHDRRLALRRELLELAGRSERIEEHAGAGRRRSRRRRRSDPTARSPPKRDAVPASARDLVATRARRDRTGRARLSMRSVEGEQRREDDHDRGGPEGEDRQVGRSASARAGGACCAASRNRADSHAVPARFTSRTRLRPSAAVRFGGEPELADPSDHRAEHHHVEHEGADDGDQLDAVHPVRRRATGPARTSRRGRARGRPPAGRRRR